MRAYQNTSLSLRAMSEDIANIKGRGELCSIPGISHDDDPDPWPS